MAAGDIRETSIIYQRATMAAGYMQDVHEETVEAHGRLILTVSYLSYCESVRPEIESTGVRARHIASTKTRIPTNQKFWIYISKQSPKEETETT